MQEIIIGNNEAGQRFDKYLHKYFKEAPGSFIYKMLRKKNIELNGKKATGSEKLNTGDSVKLFMADETIAKFRGMVGQTVAAVTTSEVSEITPKKAATLEAQAKNSRLVKNQLIYEDENILILDKPAGILSQKAMQTDISINEMIIDYLLCENKLTEEQLQTFKPSVCNRLDRNTTGLITFGKTLKGIQELSLGFKERTFDKYYLAAVWGRIEKSSLIDGYLTKDEKTNKVSISTVPKDKDASHIQTAYEPLAYNIISDKDNRYDITLLKIKLITGKTHQIRAHLSSINHSLLGDDKYGIKKRNEFLKKHYNIKWQLLHSYELSFNNCGDFEVLSSLYGTTITASPGEVYTQLFGDIS